MGDILYCLPFVFMWAGLQQPLVLVGVLAVVLGRSWLPDPVALIRTWRRMDRLARETTANPANATARRDLALLYLAQRRPARACLLLEQALSRFPDDAELLYLLGRARHRRGEHAAALRPLVRSLEVDPGVRFGEPYLLAGDALSALGRHAEALDAYERYTARVSSSLEGHVKRARAHRALGEETSARGALDEASRTWSALPRYMKRRALGWRAVALGMRVR